MSDEEGQIDRWIAGALRSTIDAHGPITREMTGSAAKRVRRQLESIGAARVATDEARAAMEKQLAPMVDGGDAGILVNIILASLQHAGLVVVEAVDLRVSGIAAHKPERPHHPGNKQSRQGGYQ